MRKILYILMLLTQCFYVEKGFSAPSKKASVFIQAAKLSDVSDRLTYPGRVRSKIEAQVLVENEGLIQKIAKPVGSFVKKGEAVLVIQNTDPFYKFAKVSVVAPTQGYLSRLDVSLMSKIEKGAPLFMITDPEQLKVEIEIPAADLPSFKIGVAGKVQLKVHGDTQVESDGKIIGLSPLVDPKTGTATAQLEFVKAVSSNIRPGVVVQVVFDVNQRNSILVPSSAILYKESKPFVRVLEEGKIKKVPVQVRSDLGGSVELSGGLKEGSQIVTRSNRFLADGDEVEVETSKKE